MTGAFGCIIADPPWAYRDRMLGMKSTGNGAAHWYEVMSVERISDFLAEQCVQVLDDAHLWLWATNAFVEQAHAVARAWGFEPKTIATWVKGRIDNGRLVSHIAQGRYLRNNTEHVVFAVRGRAKPAVRNIPTAFVHPGRWPGRKHSDKPYVIHEWAERMSPAPRLELFARRERAGWTCLGREVAA